MSCSSYSEYSECSTWSRTDFETSEDSTLDRSVSLPRRATCHDQTASNNSKGIIFEDDPVWCTEYAQDIFSYLRSVEGSRRSIMYKSRQIYHRSNLVKLIKRISQSENLGRTTVHLAIYMLDVAMDAYNIITAKLNLVALVCLLIAAKIEECYPNIPKIATLNSYTDNPYMHIDFKILERKILNFFKFSVTVPTTATYVESYVRDATTFDEIRDSLCHHRHESGDNLPILETTPDENVVQDMNDTCKRLVFEFLELTLDERRMVHAKPSLQSAACIAASRKVCCMTPMWPERLVTLTGCSYEVIEEYAEALISLHNYNNRKIMETLKRTPDSGCPESESDSHDDEVYFCPVPFKKKRLSY